MTHKSELGNYGEDLACEYLVNNKYLITDRNYRKPWGEIDIIALDPDKTLVFIEVKTLQKTRIFNQLKPEDQITRAKLNKLSKTSSIYANNNPALINNARGWRIDLIAITVSEDEPLISHYKNIL